MLSRNEGFLRQIKAILIPKATKYCNPALEKPIP